MTSYFNALILADVTVVVAAHVAVYIRSHSKTFASTFRGNLTCPGVLFFTRKMFRRPGGGLHRGYYGTHTYKSRFHSHGGYPCHRPRTYTFLLSERRCVVI